VFVPCGALHSYGPPPEAVNVTDAPVTALETEVQLGGGTYVLVWIAGQEAVSEPLVTVITSGPYILPMKTRAELPSSGIER